MTKSEFEVKYRAKFQDAGDAMAQVVKSLYVMDIDATEVHVDTTPEEKKRRRLAAVKADHPSSRMSLRAPGVPDAA